MARAAKPTKDRLYLTGKLIALRPVALDDLPAMAAWDDDPEIIALMGQKFGSLETLQEWYCRTRSDRACRALAVETLDGQLIGEVELDRIDWRTGMAELRICIGVKSSWGQGYGSDVLRLFLGLAFEQWGLRRIYLRVYAANQRAVRLYQRLGFITKGVLAPSPRRGDRSEIWLMEITREQFTAFLRRHSRTGA